MPNIRIYTSGQKFNRLTVVRPSSAERFKGHVGLMWECLCDCGRMTTVPGSRLFSGGIKSCGCLRLERISKHGLSGTPVYFMWGSAKRRAKDKNLPFNISVEDIRIPKRCPLLGLKLFPNVGGSSAPNSPTLDRIIPKLGYVKGNVRVISNKANLMKQDATLEELEKLVSALRLLQHKASRR